MGLLSVEYPEIFFVNPLRNKDVITYLKSHSSKRGGGTITKIKTFLISSLIKLQWTKHGSFCIIWTGCGKRKDLISHWDYQHYLNKKTSRTESIPTLFDFGITSKEGAFWKCPNGHREPQPVQINAKASRGRGKKQKTEICTRCHSIAYTHPEIAKLFDTKRNKKDVWDISAGCGDKVYWICDMGHSYPMRVNVKVREFGKWGGNGCNICSGHLTYQKLIASQQSIQIYYRNGIGSETKNLVYLLMS